MGGTPTGSEDALLGKFLHDAFRDDISIDLHNLVLVVLVVQEIVIFIIVTFVLYLFFFWFGIDFGLKKHTFAAWKQFNQS